MLKLLGTDFIRSLALHPQVIITTAYREYALEGYELNILDYLLKPISFSRFFQAVNKAGGTIGAAGGNSFDENRATPPRPFVYLKSDRIMIRAYLEDIVHAEGLKNYVRVKTTGKDIITFLSLNALEEKLAGNGFTRMHRSFIVNTHRIEKYTAEFVEAGGYNDSHWQALQGSSACQPQRPATHLKSIISPQKARNATVALANRLPDGPYCTGRG
jgi:DNA-binding LytR/AlgR family response regulator